MTSNLLIVCYSVAPRTVSMIVTILPMDRKDEPSLFVAMHKYDFVWFPPVKKKKILPWGY